MVTNFFQSLESLGANCDWTICIERGKEGQHTVSILPVNDKIGDDARKIIQPMIFKGTAQELDNGLFTSLQMPVQKITGLFVNMESHMKSIEDARKKSKMETDKTDKDRKEKDKEKNEAKKAVEEQKVQKDEKKSRYEAILKTVADLEAEKKYKEAIDSLPGAAEFPEYADAINKRFLELMQKNISPGLF